LCQLTLLDFQDQRFAKFIAKPLTELNTIGIAANENNDGFGYLCFNNLEVINKSKDSAQIWWSEHLTEWKRKHKNPNGLYHVRACSYGSKTKVGEEFSHPFSHGNLVMMHNGTMTFRYKNAPDVAILESELDDKQIDSYNFLRTLSVFVEQDPPLKMEHFNKVIKNWTGSFAIMAIDKRNPSKVFIAKDADKLLHICTFKVGKTNVGLIVNTQVFELEYAAELLIDYAAALNTKLTYTIHKLDDLKVWEYTVGSFNFPQKAVTIVLPELITKVPVAARNYHGLPGNLSPRSGFYSSVSYEKVAKFSEELGLTYLEILVMSELLFKETFFTFDDNMMSSFADFLEYLSNNNGFKGRRKIWLENLNRFTRIDFYTKTQLSFPYFLNSRAALKFQIGALSNRETKLL